jgi:hypothetical protein
MFCYANNNVMFRFLIKWIFIALLTNAYLTTVFAYLTESGKVITRASMGLQKILGKGYRRRLT